MVARILKFLHELGSIGTLGAVVTCLILLGRSNPSTLHDPGTHADIYEVVHYLLMPSFAAVLLSGLLAIAATPTYINAGWAWVKALLGISVFEASLSLSATSKEVLELVVQNAATPAVIQATRVESGTLWVLCAVSLINVVFGIWRPRLLRLS